MKNPPPPPPHNACTYTHNFSSQMSKSKPKVCLKWIHIMVPSIVVFKIGFLEIKIKSNAHKQIAKSDFGLVSL